MTTTAEHIAAIRKALEAGPTPGEWKGVRGGETGFIRGIDASNTVIVRWHGLGSPASKQGQANASLIISCNPVAMTAVLAELDRLKEENEAKEAKLRGQGMAIAAGIIMACWGEDTFAREIMGAAGYKSVSDLEADGVDEYDINLLRPLFEVAALKGEAK